MLQQAVRVNSNVIYYCHELLMKAFDKMLFGYMVLKGEESLLNFIAASQKLVSEHAYTDYIWSQPEAENSKLWYKKAK